MVKLLQVVRNYQRSKHVATAYKITDPQGAVRIVVTDDPASISNHVKPGEALLLWPEEFIIPVPVEVITEILNGDTSIPG